MEEATKNRDFESFARLTCADSNQFHAVCLDTSPPIFYMNDTSHRIISLVEKWNHSEGTPQDGKLLRAKFLVDLLNYNENESKDNIPEVIREILNRLRD